MGMIGVVEGCEGGFVDDFGSECEITGFVGVEFVELLYGGAE